jgi:hypothetical protein
MLRNQEIMTLCEQLLKASTQEESVELASQLKAALHEHFETLRGNLLVSIPPRDPASEEAL